MEFTVYGFLIDFAVIDYKTQFNFCASDRLVRYKMFNLRE